MGSKKEIELHEDMRHQRREWLVERIGWAAMALILIAALLGLVGPGPMSKRSAEGGSGLKVEYERFARYQAPMDIRVHFPAAAPSGNVKIAFNREFYEANEIEVAPQPEKTELTPDKVIFMFPTLPGGGDSAATFRIHPNERWERQVTVTLNDTQSVSFRIFVYP